MKLFSPLVVDHWRHPRNFRRLESPDLAHEALSVVCGDRIRLELKLEGARIAQAAFRGDGCALAIAAASMLTELLQGRSLAEAALIPDQALLSSFDAELPRDRRQCVLLPLVALRAALAERADVA